VTAEVPAEHEPKIEDAAHHEEEKKEDGDAGGEDEKGNRSKELVEDAQDSLQATIQLLEDFNSSALFSSASERAKVVANLLIDSYIRLGDILLFKEACEDAIIFYLKAIDLCKEHFEGNERTMSSTLIILGGTF
jgi:hypothetical protein